jgi:hypothetical protein
LLALSLSPRGVVNPKHVVADALETMSDQPELPDSLRRASSSADVLAGNNVASPSLAAKHSSKRHCLLCRQRFATAVALNQHIKQQHQCAQCGEVARVAYRVDAEGVARRLCSRCAVTELLAAAVPGTPRIVPDMPPSPNNGILPIAPVSPISPRSAYVAAVLQARVRAASRGTSPEREQQESPSPTTVALNSSGGLTMAGKRRNTKSNMRRGSHDTSSTPLTTTPMRSATPPTLPTTTMDVPPPLPPDQIRADDDNFVAEPPPPLLPNPTVQQRTTTTTTTTTPPTPTTPPKSTN